jgi:hypothetical protein
MKKNNPSKLPQIAGAIFVAFLCLFTSAHPLTAQAPTPSKDSICPSWDYQEEIVPQYFKPGFQTAIFGNNVNVRKSPSPTGAVLEMLPIGQAVEVIAVDTARLTLNGRTAGWHLVAWSNAKKEQKQGWVWGGYLSLAGGGCPGQLSFLLGCTEVQKNSADRGISYVHEIRAIKNFQLMDKITLPAVALNESQVFHFSIMPSRGLPEVQNVVYFNWAMASCPGLQQEFYALWTTTGHFQLLPPLESMGEEGDTEIEQYIFPDEMNDVKYEYPLKYFLEKPENKSAILYLKEDGYVGENEAGASISITKLKFVNNVWRK